MAAFLLNNAQNKNFKSLYKRKGVAYGYREAHRQRENLFDQIDNGAIVKVFGYTDTQQVRVLTYRVKGSPEPAVSHSGESEFLILGDIVLPPQFISPFQAAEEYPELFNEMGDFKNNTRIAICDDFSLFG